MVVYRVGRGRSSTGKILDRDTKWFTDFKSALEYAQETKKEIYVSYNNGPYKLYE